MTISSASPLRRPRPPRRLDVPRRRRHPSRTGRRWRASQRKRGVHAPDDGVERPRRRGRRRAAGVQARSFDRSRGGRRRRRTSPSDAAVALDDASRRIAGQECQVRVAAPWPASSRSRHPGPSAVPQPSGDDARPRPANWRRLRVSVSVDVIRVGPRSPAGPTASSSWPWRQTSSAMAGPGCPSATEVGEPEIGLERARRTRAGPRSVTTRQRQLHAAAVAVITTDRAPRRGRATVGRRPRWSTVQWQCGKPVGRGPRRPVDGPHAGPRVGGAGRGVERGVLDVVAHRHHEGVAHGLHVHQRAAVVEPELAVLVVVDPGSGSP